MKIPTLLAGLCLMVGCTSTTTSQESISEDTVKITTVTPDSVVGENLDKPVFEVTDSAALALKALVDSEFDTLYQLLADSANYYKVVYEDYYDEYEGQSELKRSTWYFDKELNIVYAKYSYANGSMGIPDITEYITKDNLVIKIKQEEEFKGGEKNRTFTRWTTELGGLVINWLDYFKKPDSVNPLPEGYVKYRQDEWDSNLSIVPYMVNGEQQFTDKDGIYTILIEKPKQSELLDYEKLVIPKEVYNKLHTD